MTTMATTVALCIRYGPMPLAAPIPPLLRQHDRRCIDATVIVAEPSSRSSGSGHGSARVWTATVHTRSHHA